MKILVRILGIAAVGLLMIYGFIYLINTNIIINELNDCSSLAMKQTQEVMKQIVISDLDRNHQNLFNDLTYEEYYEKCFNEAVQDSNIYKLNVEGDEQKGILHVVIDVSKYRFIPQKELLHLIDVEGDGLDNIEDLYYETTISSKKTRVNNSWKDFSAKTLVSVSSNDDDPIKITDYSFTVKSVNSTGDSRSIIGPYIELNCIDKNGNKTLLASDNGGEYNESIISSGEGCSCKLFELSMPKGLNQSDYSIKTNSIELVRGSYYSLETFTRTLKKDYKLSNDVDISMRYINNINKLNDKSIWIQNKEYTKVLEEYIEKLK